MSDSVLNTYFKHALVKAGFPDTLNIEYSLNHCQGDGVAFYGRLGTDDLIQLFNHLNPQKRKQKMFANLLTHIESWETHDDIGFEIIRNRFGYRYSHWNTMELYAKTADQLVFFNDSDARRNWYFPTSKVYKYKGLWDEFIQDLEQYIKGTSRELETNGYQIIDASPYQTETVFKFNTENYLVELKRKPSEFYSEPVDWVFGDVCDFKTSIEELLQGKVYYADFEAIVTDKESGIQLGFDSISGLSYSPNDRTFSGYRQELIGNAIASARSNAARFAYLHA
ncbi:hypothetical protein ABCW44_07320 [Mannheimia haemolytica]|uniref:hypothetical protein n=1 Tax=Mannheimia haemolytica TaxID=75985 RepID=UPI00034A12F1|nr:hypothetical protein [Mannheimia haemolytica]AGI35132.2 hypothetical protein D648_11280 [Mannheimia haemolytica USDA-ARS-USMARC-185]UQX78408.1 hypothetical protein M3710_05875 [Mannheimia haemolytica]UQX78739.1 hypothetical protein M3703_07615 [Mannheimia haemolytica]HDZ6745961.1 hypothetical protein [Mannheimia haemolytica]HDZ6811863.1 hypothetical protein [Mannheimia haemolytica]